MTEFSINLENTSKTKILAAIENIRSVIDGIKLRGNQEANYGTLVKQNIRALLDKCSDPSEPYYKTGRTPKSYPLLFLLSMDDSFISEEIENLCNLLVTFLDNSQVEEEFTTVVIENFVENLLCVNRSKYRLNTFRPILRIFLEIIISEGKLFSTGAVKNKYLPELACLDKVLTKYFE